MPPNTEGEGPTQKELTGKTDMKIELDKLPPIAGGAPDLSSVVLGDKPKLEDEGQKPSTQSVHDEIVERRRLEAAGLLHPSQAGQKEADRLRVAVGERDGRISELERTVQELREKIGGAGLENQKLNLQVEDLTRRLGESDARRVADLRGMQAQVESVRQAVPASQSEADNRAPLKDRVKKILEVRERDPSAIKPADELHFATLINEDKKATDIEKEEARLLFSARRDLHNINALLKEIGDKVKEGKGGEAQKAKEGFEKAKKQFIATHMPDVIFGDPEGGHEIMGMFETMQTAKYLNASKAKKDEVDEEIKKTFLPKFNSEADFKAAQEVAKRFLNVYGQSKLPYIEGKKMRWSSAVGGAGVGMIGDLIKGLFKGIF